MEPVSPEKTYTMIAQKASTTMVTKWLNDNFEAAESSSLPRSTVYVQYEAYCKDNSIEVLNAASFGKLIRHVFPNIKTRRLGTRGNSKYHYYGINVRQTSSLMLYHVPKSDMPKPKSKIHNQTEQNHNNLYLSNGSIGSSGGSIGDGGQNNLNPRAIHLPEFIISISLPNGFQSICQDFLKNYHTYYQLLLSSITILDLPRVENLIVSFNAVENKELMQQVIECEEFVNILLEKDRICYDFILHYFFPTVFQTISLPVLNFIREFCKKFEQWEISQIVSFPETFLTKKINSIRKFVNLLFRQSSLASLSSTIRQITENPVFVVQILKDIEQTDLKTIFENSQSFVSHHHFPLISSYFFELTNFLHSRVPVDKWIFRLRDIFQEKLTDDEFPLVLYKFSAFSSLLSTNLTFRNASSIGSIHLIRAMIEEFITYYFTFKHERPNLFENPPPNFDQSQFTFPSTPIIGVLPTKDPFADGTNISFSYSGIKTEENFSIQMDKHTTENYQNNFFSENQNVSQGGRDIFEFGFKRDNKDNSNIESTNAHNFAEDQINRNSDSTDFLDSDEEPPSKRLKPNEDTLSSNC